MSEDPHERELDELEEEVKKLESADKQNVDEVKDGNTSQSPTETPADKTYEEKSKDEWKHNDKKPESRFTLTEDELIVEEADY